MRWPTLLFSVILGIVEVATGSASEQSLQVVQTAAAFAPGARAPAPRSLPVSLVSNRTTDSGRVEHLRKAAEHLQAAGLNSLADHVRELSCAPRAKESARDTGSKRQPTRILFHFKLLELNKNRCRRLGFDFSPPQSVKDARVLNGFVEALRKNGLVRVLAEPTLVTVAGRSAQLHSGGEVLLWDVDSDGKPIQRLEPFGTFVTLVPHLTGKNDLRIELRFEQSEVDRTKTVLVGAKENPVIRKRMVQTVLEMKLGDTIALFFPLHARGSAGSDLLFPEIVLQVTAEAVKPMAANPARPPRR